VSARIEDRAAEVVCVVRVHWRLDRDSRHP
jgi:hypothetical protein